MVAISPSNEPIDCAGGVVLTTCPIIVKFNSFKDRATVRRAAFDKLDSQSRQKVSEDFTQRVRETRKTLCSFLVRARNNGHTASMKFDKLVIDGNVYKYDPQTHKPVCIASNTPRRRTNDNQTNDPYPWNGQPRASNSPIANNRAGDPERSDNDM